MGHLSTYSVVLDFETEQVCVITALVPGFPAKGHRMRSEALRLEIGNGLRGKFAANGCVVAASEDQQGDALVSPGCPTASTVSPDMGKSRLCPAVCFRHSRSRSRRHKNGRGGVATADGRQVTANEAIRANIPWAHVVGDE